MLKVQIFIKKKCSYLIWQLFLTCLNFQLVPKFKKKKKKSKLYHIKISTKVMCAENMQIIFVCFFKLCMRLLVVTWMVEFIYLNFLSWFIYLFFCCWVFLYWPQGEGINFSPLKQSPEYPLIYAKYAKKSGANEAEARYT